MRNSLLPALLFIPTLACGEDPPTRPDDGTVQVWDECIWEGQYVRELCQPELVCAWNGLCVPRCEALSECQFDGFVSECQIQSEENVCQVRCNEERECPSTGGPTLKCVHFHCVRDPNAPEPE
jgi:hypothetical protein